MPEFGITAEEMQRLARLVEDNNLSELRYEEGDLRITLRTASYRPHFGGAVAVAAASPAAAGSVGDIDFASVNSPGASDSSLSAPRHAAGRLQVEAPIMGVFYRSAAPGDPSFVDVGDMVDIGQVIGVIEAMKVFSEVPSDYAGRVSAIPAKNGSLVQPGDPLLVLEAV